MRFKKVLLIMFLTIANSVFSPFLSKTEAADEVQKLFDFYIKKFTPEKAVLIISERPDSTGKFNDVYMDLTGVKIDKVRLNKLTFRLTGVQFNPPSEWLNGNVDCKSAMQVYALAEIFDSDINRSIERKTFGDKDHWKKISLKIAPKGLNGRGYYVAKVLGMSLDILLEIDSKLKIVGNKQLWLDNPQVKVNRLDLPDYITKKALKQIQPLLDLRKFPLPLSINKVELRNGSARIYTKKLPQAIKNGIRYNYPK